MNNPWIDTVRPEWMDDETQKALIHYGFPQTLNGLLQLQQKAKAQLDFWKEKELEWRKLYAANIPNKHEGMNTIPLDALNDAGKPLEAKVQVKYNYKLDDNDKVWSGLDRIKALGNEGAFVADRLVSWTPNFLLTEYRQLQEDAEKGSQFAKDALKAIGEFLTISEAAPTVEVKEVKKGKK
jgi:hypothetical protein